MSSTEVAGSISGADNNSDSKNIYVKVGFSTYNIVSVNADVGTGAGDINDTRNAGDTGDMDNNANNKNTYTKTDFNIYNVTSANTGTYTGDAIVTNKKVGSNINNTSVGYLSRMGRTDKGKIGGADKCGASKANKNRGGRNNIEASKKADAEAIASTKNNANGVSKVTNQYAGLVGLAFTTLATANYAGNFNLAIFEEIPLGAATSTPNEFLATFTALVNIILKRKPEIGEFNLFLFIVNHQ